MAPRAVLALTATASSAIQSDICSHLFIDRASGLLALSAQRDNLRLSSQVGSNENDKRAAILRLVRSPQISTDQQQTGSIVRRGLSKPLSPLTIVYVWRRDEADSLGEFLKANGISTVIYHAGNIAPLLFIHCSSQFYV
jgi:superfamily II DNA helicase RecQ